MPRNINNEDLNPRGEKNRDDKQENKDFPGYPHYPSSEDITLKGKKEDVDVENISRSGSTPISPRDESTDQTSSGVDLAANDEIGIVQGTSADVTSDDIRILESTDGMRPTSRLEESDDIQEELKQSDLDIPGAESDDSNENIGEEDEENNYYSLGGDRMENLENDQS